MEKGIILKKSSNCSEFDYEINYSYLINLLDLKGRAGFHFSMYANTCRHQRTNKQIIIKCVNKY